MVRVRAGLYVAALVASFRLVIFWWLFLQLQTNNQSISMLPLVLLLYPEGLLVPNNHHWTVSSGALFSAVLVVGTFALIGLVALFISMFRRALRQKTAP